MGTRTIRSGGPPRIQPADERFKRDSGNADSRVRLDAKVMHYEAMSNKPQPEPHSRVRREVTIA